MTSKRQSTVALSTSEAEYIALFTASKEGVWLRQPFFWFWSGANKHQTHGYQVSLCARNGWATGCSDSLLPHWHYVSGHPDQATSWAAVWIFTIRPWCCDRIKCDEWELSHNYVFRVVYGDADRLAFQQTYSFLPAHVMNIIFIWADIFLTQKLQGCTVQ